MKETPCLQNIFEHSINLQVLDSKVQYKENIQVVFILHLSINDDDEFVNSTAFDILGENQMEVRFYISQC